MLLPILQRSWGPDTCDPSDLADWHPGNPSRGQCGATALVVREILGGDLVLGRVLAGGRPAGHHYWNRLADGSEVDLTRDQFSPDEVVSAGVVVAVPAGPPRRCRGQHALLRHRVLTGLGRLPAPHPGAPPARLALALMVDPGGAVLLRRRSPDAPFEPGQWALPAAAVHPDEPAEQAARRGLAEEAAVGFTGRLHPHWSATLPDVTGAAARVEVEVFAGRCDLDGAGIVADDLAETDLAPTAAAVLQGLVRSSRARPARAEAEAAARCTGPDARAAR